MSDAPERIWAQDADPNECDFIGGGWWDADVGCVQYPHTVEYIRADKVQALVDAERERCAALVEADEKRFVGVARAEQIYANACHYTGRAVQCFEAAKAIRALQGDQT